MTYYNLRSTGTALYSITKFDNSLNPEASYSVGSTICDCPAGHRPSCRHRQMLPILKTRVDTAWFWEFETGQWEDPTGEANKPATEDTSEVDEDQVSSPEGFGPWKDTPEEALAATKPAPAFKRRL